MLVLLARLGLKACGESLDSAGVWRFWRGLRARRAVPLPAFPDLGRRGFTNSQLFSKLIKYVT